MSDENRILYEERLKRINDTVNLKEPDRVPFAPMYEAFPFLNAGYTMAEVNYDTANAHAGHDRYQVVAMGRTERLNCSGSFYFSICGKGIPPGR